MLEVDVVVERGEFTLEAELSVGRGEVVAVMGRNGAGKSTLLNTIAGLLRPSSGAVSVGGRMLSNDSVWVAPHERRVGLLGQDPLLFPHLTALKNVMFGARSAPPPEGGRASSFVARAELQERALGWLELLGVDGLAGRRPAELSGGQQQRVAIARALAASPEVLLLDEPLVSLDVESLLRIRRVLAELLRGGGFASVLVTHDPVDALELADRVVLLDAGRVVDVGAPREVFVRADSIFAAELYRNATARW